ncbi:hypothetical protein [Helicobacter pylori]|uniref:hypothetical protein n=1 Tax=Helicobacter pylori TaxID=210 RepID=UPI00053522C6|nr:hypothetical protein [Helicobacter pylori]
MRLNYKTKTLINQGVRRWKESQSHPVKKTAMFTLKFGESLTIEHDCKNLMEVKIQTDKGSKTLHFKLPQPKEEDR